MAANAVPNGSESFRLVPLRSVLFRFVPDSSAPFPMGPFGSGMPGAKSLLPKADQAPVGQGGVDAIARGCQAVPYGRGGQAETAEDLTVGD